MNRIIDTTKTPHIAPACLPKDSYKFKDDQKCYIVGWGDDVYKVSPLLISAVLSYSKCGLGIQTCYAVNIATLFYLPSLFLEAIY